MTTGKSIALTLQTFVSKVMSLEYTKLVIAFLSRSKLISSLQSPSAVILEPKKIKFVTVSIVSPSICHEVMGPDEGQGYKMKTALSHKLEFFTMMPVVSFNHVLLREFFHYKLQVHSIICLTNVV